MPELSPEITAVLEAWTAGDSSALDQLMPLVFAELRQIARSQLAQEPGRVTLQPTALVNEVYLRLVGRRTVNWRNRAHFFGGAAHLMRQILIDHARRRLATKRGRNPPSISIEEGGELVDFRAVDLLALDEALHDLKRLDPRQSRIVELRFFTGLNNHEIAEVLEVSERTVRREWETARLFLMDALG